MKHPSLCRRQTMRRPRETCCTQNRDNAESMASLTQLG
jgi:hypothetical protein